MAISLHRAVPVLRIYSLEKAREFYVDFLGFSVDWESAFGDGGPVYMQVSRDGLRLHLSEHHSDGTPGSVAYIVVSGVRDLHRELNDRQYRHNRPGLVVQDWGMTELPVIDPFGNRLIFGEPTEDAGAGAAA